MKGTWLDKFLWALGCTLMLWGASLGIIAAFAGTIYWLVVALGVSPIAIFVGITICVLLALTFWKAWRDYEAYNP